MDPALIVGFFVVGIIIAALGQLAKPKAKPEAKLSDKELAAIAYLRSLPDEPDSQPDKES